MQAAWKRWARSRLRWRKGKNAGTATTTTKFKRMIFSGEHYVCRGSFLTTVLTTITLFFRFILSILAITNKNKILGNALFPRVSLVWVKGFEPSAS
jgi:hypothetical protein